MTNNDPIDPKALQASLDRRLADLRSTPKPIMVPPSGRIYRPRTRRTSVPHRSIR